MHVVTLNCNHCGAPLEVPAKTRFVTCAYCASRLQIHQSGNAVYSEVLEAIGQRTEKMAQDLETIKLQNEVEQLDRQWQLDLDRYKVRDREGHYQVPNRAGSLVGAVVGVVFGLFWIVFTLGAGAPGVFPLFGLLFIVLAIVGGVKAAGKADAYERGRTSYEIRRRALVGQIRGRERGKDGPAE